MSKRFSTPKPEQFDELIEKTRQRVLTTKASNVGAVGEESRRSRSPSRVAFSLSGSNSQQHFPKGDKDNSNDGEKRKSTSSAPGPYVWGGGGIDARQSPERSERQSDRRHSQAQVPKEHDQVAAAFPPIDYSDDEQKFRSKRGKEGDREQGNDRRFREQPQQQAPIKLEKGQTSLFAQNQELLRQRMNEMRPSKRERSADSSSSSSSSSSKDRRRRAPKRVAHRNTKWDSKAPEVLEPAMTPTRPLSPIREIMAAPRARSESEQLAMVLPQGAVNPLHHFGPGPALKKEPDRRVCVKYLSRNCFEPFCVFWHPTSDAEIQDQVQKFANTPCLYGIRCAKANCLYKHPRPGEPELPPPGMQRNASRGDNFRKGQPEQRKYLSIAL